MTNIKDLVWACVQAKKNLCSMVRFVNGSARQKQEESALLTLSTLARPTAKSLRF